MKGSDGYLDSGATGDVALDDGSAEAGNRGDTRYKKNIAAVVLSIVMPMLEGNITPFHGTLVSPLWCAQEGEEGHRALL
ncbi:hypothetical protein SESBI_08198 [Sesbania bispinosa]|nr:hypothetical protein SESBI_08198 [Sesbania bispinosa]